MAGFEYRYMLNGGAHPVIKDFYMKDTETFTKGDLMNVESGEVDLAATGDAGLAGAFVGTVNPDDERNSSHERTPGKVAGTDSTTLVRVIISPDAVYSTSDDNDRDAGATLDISGATGAQTVAASSNTEFVVVEDKKVTTDPTMLLITPAAHYLAKT